MEHKSIKVEDFINDYLITHIGEIKNNYPYFAFVLMSIGIEFLGKCQNTDFDWNKYRHAQPETDFNKGMELPSLKKYKQLNLYRNLRCGLAHSLSTNGNLVLSDKSNTTTLNCEEFYNAFVDACNEILSGKANMPTKKLTDTFLR